MADASRPPALAGVRHVVAVLSGKGGVGKSSTTVNVGWALAELGARVGLLDADVFGPSLDLMTGVGLPEELDGQLLVPPSRDGISVASAGMFLTAARPLVLRGPRVAAVLEQLLTGFAWGALDYLLVDCPPGTGDVPLTLAKHASLTGAVLVTTPQDVAVADARRAATMLRLIEVPLLGVVETMSGFVCGDCGARHPIFAEGGGQRLADELGAPLLGRIPLDPLVVAGADRGEPVVRARPDAPVSHAYRDAAAAIAARVSAAGPLP